MHSVTVRMHADQTIKIGRKKVNVHDIKSITVYEDGKIHDFTKYEEDED